MATHASSFVPCTATGTCSGDKTGVNSGFSSLMEWPCAARIRPRSLSSTKRCLSLLQPHGCRCGRAAHARSTARGPCRPVAPGHDCLHLLGRRCGRHELDETLHRHPTAPVHFCGDREPDMRRFPRHAVSVCFAINMMWTVSYRSRARRPLRPAGTGKLRLRHGNRRAPGTRL